MTLAQKITAEILMRHPLKTAEDIREAVEAVDQLVASHTGGLICGCLLVGYALGILSAQLLGGF